MYRRGDSLASQTIEFGMLLARPICDKSFRYAKKPESCVLPKGTSVGSQEGRRLWGGRWIARGQMRRAEAVMLGA